MNNESKSGLLIGVVALVVAVGALFFAVTAPEPKDAGGERSGLQEFNDGITPGTQTILTQVVTIGANANQGAWKNTTGKTVYVAPTDVSIGYESGTATSSYLFYVGTSTTATYTDFARPASTFLALDGATVATSSLANTRVGTSTTAGTGFSVAPGEFVVFDIQERFFCKANAFCETATSTNRGITNFYGLLTIKYRK